MCSFLHFAGQVLYLAHLQICCECQRISQVSYLSPEFGCAMWASMTTLQTPQHLQKWHLVDHVYWNSCTRMEKQQQTFQFDLAFTARSHYLLSLMEVALGLSFSSPWSTYYTLLSTNKCFLPSISAGAVNLHWHRHKHSPEKGVGSVVVDFALCVSPVQILPGGLLHHLGFDRCALIRTRWIHGAVVNLLADALARSHAAFFRLRLGHGSHRPAALRCFKKKLIPCALVYPWAFLPSTVIRVSPTQVAVSILWWSGEMNVTRATLEGWGE